jgi:hypothetical protein
MVLAMKPSTTIDIDGICCVSDGSLGHCGTWLRENGPDGIFLFCFFLCVCHCVWIFEPFFLLANTPGPRGQCGTRDERKNSDLCTQTVTGKAALIDDSVLFRCLRLALSLANTQYRIPLLGQKEREVDRERER